MCVRFDGVFAANERIVLLWEFEESSFNVVTRDSVDSIRPGGGLQWNRFLLVKCEDSLPESLLLNSFY